VEEGQALMFVGAWPVYEAAKRALRTPEEKLLTEQDRRDRNREMRRCVNDTKHGTHGALFRHERCLRCFLVKKYGLALVIERGVEALAVDLAIEDARKNRITTVTAQQGA